MTTTVDRADDPATAAVDFNPVVDESDFCARYAIDLHPARNHGWVIRAAGSAGHEGSVLGCIEDSEDQFELMQVAGGFRWSIHDSFHEALQRLVYELPQPGNELLFDDERRSGKMRDSADTEVPDDLGHVISDWISTIVPFSPEKEASRRSRRAKRPN